MFRWIAGLGIVVLLLPVAMPFVAHAVARLLGCTLNESSSAPCRLAGVDIGGFLHSLSMLGWMGIATLPAACVVALGWIIAEAGVWFFAR